MLYSESGNYWAFVVDKGAFPPNSFRDVVNGIYSIVSARQVIKVAKQEVKSYNLIQELVEPTCEIKQDPLEEDLKHDDTFYLEMATFEFQDTDFLVPTNQFVQKTDSDHFATVFGPTFAINETPNRFSGVTASDFRSLMKYLYPLDFEDSNKLTVDDWIAVLKLSTKWRMLTLREEAIQALNNNIDWLSAIMKVQLGKECKVTEWVRSGYVALVERQEHFTEADVIAIGLASVTKLCEVREQGYAGEWDIYCNRLTLEAHGTSNLIADRISQITSSTVDHLDYDDDNLVTAIIDAQSLGNRRLMMDAWGRMARRLESLTVDEVERLTLGTALMMWEVRLETRMAAWSLIQEYGAQFNVKAVGALQRITSIFTSEFEDIEVQALEYALSRPSLDKGKKPEVYTHADTEGEEEEIPDSALQPMPRGSNALFQQSLELRRRITDLEQKLNENTDTNLDRELRKDLRRCRLSAQKWCDLAAIPSTPESTLDPRTITALTLASTLEKTMTKLILKNVGKLTLDGRRVPPKKWKTMKHCILFFATRNFIEMRDDGKAIDLILPVSEP